jgi:uncharacterized membrane protein
MTFLSNWFSLLSLTIWIGSIFFFSFITTPTVFQELPKEIASQFLAALFPRYYFTGYIVGSVLLVSSFAESLLTRQFLWFRILLILLMLGSSIYAGTILRPKIHDLKVQMKTMEEDSEPGIKFKKQFDSLHRQSVILNLIVLAGGLLLLGIVAIRLRPNFL